MRSLLNFLTSINIDKRNTKVYPEKVITTDNLKKYDQALKVSDTAIIIKDTRWIIIGGDYHRRPITMFLGKRAGESISKTKNC